MSLDLNSSTEQVNDLSKKIKQIQAHNTPQDQINIKEKKQRHTHSLWIIKKLLLISYFETFI